MVELFIKRVNDTTYSKLDLYENISLPITYSIADIRFPEQRQGTFTKTISLPGTKQNNHLFNHIFRINKVTYLSNDFILVFFKGFGIFSISNIKISLPISSILLF